LKQSLGEVELWPGFRAGLPVLIVGLAFILIILFGLQPTEGQAVWMLLAADVFVLLGFVIGWLKWFPSWAYAYAGMSLLFSLWWSANSARSDGLLPRAIGWSPLLVALAFAILLSRSIRPFLRFIQGMLRDWSLASLGLYSVLPLAMFTTMSMMPPANALLFQIPAILLMSSGAGLAGMATGARTRGRVMLLAFSWAWILVTAGVAIYWNGKVLAVSGQMVNWFEQVLAMSLIWVILAMFIFFPAGFALLGWFARRFTQPGGSSNDKNRL